MTPKLWLLPLALSLGLAIIVLTSSEGVSRPEAPLPTKGQWKKLSPETARIMEQCGTEPAFSGAYLAHDAAGTYTCGRCAAPLFSSSAKFDSRSGWPSFDDALPGAISELSEGPDGRVEIRCGRCDGHLGHVFRGEGMTAKDTRHCVNSLALGFSSQPRQEAFFAGGCFWGVEHLLEAVDGVVEASSGYMGGHLKGPSYKQVTGGASGHAETVRVVFDPDRVSYEALARHFFEIHDPGQKGHQGPDYGPQYRSAIFVVDSAQERIVRGLMARLKKKGHAVTTEVAAAGIFWPAEPGHQDYYRRTGKQPYCHSRVKRF
jgi:peptide methionine sulfoxide reductase msrA/msrB